MASRLRGIPKARFVYREDITNSMDEHPIYITYSVERKAAKTDTTVWLKREYWNDSRQCVKTTHPRYDQLNAMLQVKRHEIDERLVELNPEIELTIDLLRKIVKGEGIDDADECNRYFVDFATEVMEIEYKREKIGISVLDNSKCALHLFRRFLISNQKRDFLLIRELDERMVDNYIIWRKEQRENSNEISIRLSLQFLRQYGRLCHLDCCHSQEQIEYVPDTFLRQSIYLMMIAHFMLAECGA